MKRLVMVIGLVIGLFLLGTVVNYSWADAPEIPGKIAFIRDGNIWIAKANGDNQQKITTSADCEEASWSPDGAKILYVRAPRIYAGFVSYGYLWCYDLSTRKATRIFPDSIYRSPKWSPDSKWIAFLTFLPEKGGSEEAPDCAKLEISSPSGQNRKVIIQEGYSLSFTWSPDGKRIYYKFPDYQETYTVAFLELANPSRSHIIYKSKPEKNVSGWHGLQFISEKELVFFEMVWLNPPPSRPSFNQAVILDIDTLKFRKEILQSTYGGACFLGDVKKFWLGDWGEKLTLVVDGTNLRTIEGKQLDWVYGK